MISGYGNFSGSRKEATHNCDGDALKKPVREVPCIFEHEVSDDVGQRLRCKSPQKIRGSEQRSVKKARQQQPTEGTPAGSALKATITGISFCVYTFLASIPMVNRDSNLAEGLRPILRDYSKVRLNW